MRVQVQLNYKAIWGLQSVIERASLATMEALISDVRSAEVMPFDTGDMQNNQTFMTFERDNADNITVSLVTGSPQARRLYYHPEYNFQKVNNANAGGDWLEPWITGDKKDFVKDTLASEIRKELGQ